VNSQTPEEHDSFASGGADGQTAHTAPPVPHWLVVWEPYSTHVLPLQHPLGQELASHSHCPVVVLQYCPGTHALQVAPPEPHSVAVCDE
jgi:hypothetical protein